MKPHLGSLLFVIFPFVATADTFGEYALAPFT